MRYAVRIAIAVLLAVIFSYACHAAELIDVTASVDKQTAYIGDLIEYKIVITYDSTLQLTPPPAGANLGGFEVKDYDFGNETKSGDGRRQQELKFQLRTFTTGDYVIPPLPIEYRLPDSTVKYISADPIKIFIKSMLAEGVAADSLEPRPLKGQISLVGKSWTIWIIIGAGCLILGAALAYYFIRRKKPVEETPFVDPRPSWEIAFADLAVLKSEDLPGKGEVKRFYFELSEIIRRYLGRKFDFDASEMTTTEIGEALTRMAVDAEIRGETIAFMDHADLVKFAKYKPPADRPDTDWNSAYELVSRSKDLIVTPPVEVRPEPVIAGSSTGASDGDDSELRFAPPELREMLSSNREEDKS